MPVQLDTFRNIAAQGGSQQVLLSDPAGPQADGIKIRGSFASFVVNLFRGDGVRQEQRAVAEAFVQALQTHLSTVSGEAAQLPDALKTDYTATMHDALATVRQRLANQLDGTQALTADNIRQALSFVAEVQQDALTPLMQEAREAAVVDLAGQRLQTLQNLTASLHGGPAQAGSVGEHLAQYLSGGNYEGDKVATVAQQVRELEDAIGDAKQSLRDLRGLPGGTADRPALQALQQRLETTVADETTVELLKWFNESHRRVEMAQGHIDTHSIHLGNGDDVDNARTPRQLIEAFKQGEKLSEADRGFLDKWAHQFSALTNNLTWVHKMSEGEKDLRTRQNQLSEISEDRFRAVGDGAIVVDAELLNGAGGTTETPYQDQASLALWARRNVQVAVLQDVSLLRKQVDAIVASQGEVGQLAGDHAKAFDPKAVGDAEPPLHEPIPDAVPKRSALSQKHADINPVSSTTTEYHPVKAGRPEDDVPGISLNAAGKTARESRVHALNTALGLSQDGKTRLTLTANDYLPEAGAAFTKLAQEAGVDTATLSNAQKDLYRANLTAAMHHRQVFDAGRGDFTPEDAQRMATKQLRYAASLTPSQAVERQQAWAQMREAGTQFLSVLAQGSAGNTGGGALLAALGERSAALAPEIMTSLNPDRSEMGADEYNQIRQRSVTSVAEGLSPTVARRLLDDISRPDGMGRATLLLLGASTSARSSVSEAAASLNANDSYTFVSMLIKAVAARAGIDDVQTLLDSTTEAGVDLSMPQAKALMNGTSSPDLARVRDRAGVHNRSVIEQARQVVTEGFDLRMPEFVQKVQTAEAAGEAGRVQA
jgi:hypothetical protein